MMRSLRMFYRQRYLNSSEMYNCFMLKKAQFPPPPPKKKKDLYSLCVVDFNLSFCQMSEAEIVVRIESSFKCNLLTLTHHTENDFSQLLFVCFWTRHIFHFFSIKCFRHYRVLL